MNAYIAHAISLVNSGRPLVFYDTETTGLDFIDAPLPRIWELAALRRIGRESDAAPRRAIINCGMEIPAEANKGKVDPRLPLEKGMNLRKVLESFGPFITDAVLVGHNIAGYDNALMAWHFASVGLPVPLQLLDQRQCIDTLRLAREAFPKNQPGSPTSYKLEELGRFFGCDFDPSALHGAAADVSLTVQIFEHLILSVHPGPSEAA